MTHQVSEDGWEIDSNPSGNCVALKGMPNGEIILCNSKQPGINPIVFTRAEMRSFFEGVKAGNFDHLVS